MKFGFELNAALDNGGDTGREVYGNNIRNYLENIPVKKMADTINSVITDDEAGFKAHYPGEP